MTAKLLSALFAFSLVVGTAPAQPDPKKPAETLVTKSYNIKPLLGDGARASGVALPDTDALIKLIFESLPQLHELKPDGRQVIERDGQQLEIRATAKDHDEVKDLFAAVQRLQDLAVDVKADVIELDVVAYDKFLKSLPKIGRGKPGSPLLFATAEEFEDDKVPEVDRSMAEMNKLLKTGRVVQTSNGRFVNGNESILSSRLSVVTYYPATINHKPNGPPQFVREGFRLIGQPVVSVDRRFIRFRLTEQSVVLTQIKKREIGEVMKGQNLVLQAAETEDLGGTGSAIVADGGTLIFRLAYAPKDKVWIAVLQPRIFIREEEEELKKLEKEKK